MPDHDETDTDATDPTGRVATTGDGSDPTGAVDTKVPWWQSILRPTRAQVVVALALALVAFAVVTQVRSHRSADDYSSARREDLVQLLDQLNAETRRLESEAAELERTRAQLESGADAEEVARNEIRKRAEALAILAGTVPAEGPGIRMVILDPQRKVTPEVLLDAIEEMRDAGAEVIEINDRVRVVATSWVAAGPQGLLVDDVVITVPITIEVIGDQHALSEGAKFRGGLISSIEGPRIGGSVRLESLDLVKVDSLHTPKANQYAQPAPKQPR